MTENVLLRRPLGEILTRDDATAGLEKMAENREDEGADDSCGQKGKSIWGKGPLCSGTRGDAGGKVRGSPEWRGW